jgi:hypothetical protein
MNINETLDLLMLIADGLEPIGRMTGNSECDECRALNIRDAIEILRKIDEKYIVNLRISRES